MPLLADGAGTVYAATRTYPDGREALVMTFAQSTNATYTLQLAYGVVSWVTRGLFIGERRVYMSVQIDDFFLASRLYRGGHVPLHGGDLQAFATGRSAAREPLTAHSAPPSPSTVWRNRRHDPLTDGAGARRPLRLVTTPGTTPDLTR